MCPARDETDAKKFPSQIESSSALSNTWSPNPYEIINCASWSELRYWYECMFLCAFRWLVSLWLAVVMIMRRRCARGWRPITNRQPPWCSTIAHVVFTMPSMLLSHPKSSLPPSLLPSQPPPVKTLCYSSKHFLHPCFSLVSNSFKERIGFRL